jgi:hypothetical protein
MPAHYEVAIAEPTSRIKDLPLFRDLLFRLGFDVTRVEEKWKFPLSKPSNQKGN